MFCVPVGSVNFGDFNNCVRGGMLLMWGELICCVCINLRVCGFNVCFFCFGAGLYIICLLYYVIVVGCY